jgi:hypothetical protein
MNKTASKATSKATTKRSKRTTAKVAKATGEKLTLMSGIAGGIAGGIGLGAGLMYLLDPDRGKRRRAMVGQKLTSSATAMNRAISMLGGLTYDLRNRAQGLAAETRGRLRHEEVDDRVLEARVRSRIGHVISHASDVRVRADHGCVDLIGKLPADESETVLAAVSKVRGVKGLSNHVEVH